MPARPASGTLRPVAPVLQRFVNGLANEPGNFVYPRVLPPIPVTESTGRFFTVSTDAFFGDVDMTRERASGALYDQAKGWDATTTTYATVEYGLEANIDIRKLETTSLAGVKGFHIEQLMTDLKIQRERRLYGRLITDTTFTQTTIAAGDAWNVAGSDPIDDIATIVETIQANGLSPNKGVFGVDSHNALRRNASILSFMSDNSDRNILSDDAVASKVGEWFGLEYIVGRCVVNTVSIGQAATLGNLWGDDVFIGHVDQSGSGAAMGGGIGLRPSAAARLQEFDFIAEEYDDNPHRSTVVRLRESVDELAVNANLGLNLTATAP